MVALTAISISSCVGPQGPQGPAGRDGKDGKDGVDGISANFFTTDLIVRSIDWRWNNQGGYYYCTFALPQLTTAIYNFGTVNCYHEYYSGTADAYQIALPEIKHNAVLAYYDAQQHRDVYEYYDQTIDYIFGVNFLEIDLMNSDFSYFVDSRGNLVYPEDMVFRLNFVY